MHAVHKSILVLALAGTAALAAARPLFGFTPFPYDATEQAVKRVQELTRDNATLYALHFDDGVPWEELLDGKPLPRKIQREWDDLARAAPPGRPVYVGLTPLAKDRKSLAPGRGDKDYLPVPWSLKFADLDDDKVKAAYLEYARRAVRQFKPDFLNLGIEAGEMASRDPKRWPRFEALYRHVAAALKREFPDLKIGLSYGLQSLRKPGVAERALALGEASDYVCVSFYPHASPFGERFGEPALPAGDDAWREPLAWLRAATRKPIAICETGYLTQEVTLAGIGLTMRGDLERQARYVRDLAQTAERDDYLFVVWYLAVDYDRLFERMGGNTPANEVNLLWRNIGLWDGNVKPKPALEAWQRAIASGEGRAPARAAPPPAVAAPRPAPPPAAGVEIGFRSERELFQAGPRSRMELADGGAVWRYDYPKNDWVWALRELGARLPAATKRMALALRSDRPGPIFLQLEDDTGQAFFAMLEPGTQWSDVSIALADFKPDPAKRRDGVLRPERIVKLLLADAAGRDKAQGARSVWLARWRFE